VGEVKFCAGPAGAKSATAHWPSERSETAPSEADFPYAMRVVSDILESNGSSSMATVAADRLQ